MHGFHHRRDGTVARVTLDAASNSWVVATARFEPHGVEFARSTVPFFQTMSIPDVVDAAMRSTAEPLSLGKGIQAFGLVEEGAAERTPSLHRAFDDRAIQALACLGDYGRGIYDFYAGDGPVADVRRQAAASYPLFAGLMTSLPLRIAIETRRPLAEALSSALGVGHDGAPLVGKAHLKRFAGLRFADGGLDPRAIARFAAQLPVEWFPKDVGEWGAFLTVVEGVGGRMGEVLDGDPRAVLKASKGRWSDVVSSVCLANADRRVDGWRDNAVSRDAFVSACEGVSEMTKSFRDLVYLPSVGISAIERKPYVSVEWGFHASNKAYDVLFGGVALVKAVEAQRLWHTKVNAILDVIGDMPSMDEARAVEIDGWPPLCDEVVAPNGIVLMPLTDPREIKAEGKRLSHCVGTMGERCRRGEDFIVAFRELRDDGSHRSLSTARYHVNGTFDAIENMEHRRYKNQTPNPACLQAREWFERSVKDGTIPLNGDRVMSYVGSRRQNFEEISSWCGYDWTLEETVETMYGAWREFLPASLPRDLAGFVADERVASFAEELVPSFGRYAAALAAPGR